MPTYDYICEHCGNEFERFQSITAPVLRKCDQCGKMKLKRLIGAGSGIIFKGTGFYQTDYRSDSYNKAKNSEESSISKAKTDSKSTKKTKSKKPADKTKSEPKNK